MATAGILAKPQALKNPLIEGSLRIPGATYRLQFSHNFTFRQAEALVDYLHELGVTDCYAAPFLKAGAGSLHGYDTTDPTSFNPEVGIEEDFRNLVCALQKSGMGLIADIVPNHMGISDDSNHWWRDVLENGPSSAYASFFDIDWHPSKPELADKVLLPILGNQYGWALENQDIQIYYKNGGFVARYFEKELPIAPRTWQHILGPSLKELRSCLKDADPQVLEMESIITAISHIPSRSETDPKRIKERTREQEVIRNRISNLIADSPEAELAVEITLQRLNGTKENPDSFDALEKLLADQAYRLSYWRVAADEVNYRRFFDVSDLAAIRVERPEVFAGVHGLILRLVGEGLITGLRIDHVDGLRDPEGYLTQLQQECMRALGKNRPEKRPFLILVEKILLGKERLRSSWPVHGTTGYDFLNAVNALFIHPRGVRLIERGYSRLTGNSRSFVEILRYCKKVIMSVSMSSEVYMLATRLDRISEQYRWSRDFTFEGLRFALREVLASFPVYRTYIGPEDVSVSSEDRSSILSAIQQAKRKNPATDESIFDFIGSVLLLEDPARIGPSQKALRRDFVMRLQQVTGTIMAKSMEDTAFYRHYALGSMNEVGGNPGRLPISSQEAHAANIERLEKWPHSMCATSTHDTKRGEDVRARINALTEIPSEWLRAVLRWQRFNRRHKAMYEGTQVPDSNEEYLLYQTLVGIWPFGEPTPRDAEPLVRRVQDYMLKAMREAKVNTSWLNPNKEREDMVMKFVDSILTLEETPFLEDFVRFHSLVARAGIFNSLSQTLIKIASPGIPDFYQGSELWDFSLVDPDNRRPVDFEHRRQLLQSLPVQNGSLSAELIRDLLKNPEDGRIKLHLIRSGLSLRSSDPELFARGAYLPLRTDGERRGHIFAFARTLEGRAVVAAAGRYFIRLGCRGWPPIGRQAWGGTTLLLDKGFENSRFRDVVTGARIDAVRMDDEWVLPVEQAFSCLPAALLERIG